MKGCKTTLSWIGNRDYDSLLKNRIDTFVKNKINENFL